ncbi:MAG: AAA family ATPase [Planctomycetota bacterium]|nr:MAG: AAA family ATPase [Planctomycetota bacterium]
MKAQSAPPDFFDGTEEIEGAPMPEAQSPTPLQFEDAWELIQREIPAPLALAHPAGLLDCGELGLIVGNPASGKTLFALNFAAATAAGKVCAPLRIVEQEPVPVLVILPEYNAFRARERLRAVHEPYGVRPGLLQVLHRDCMRESINLAGYHDAEQLADRVRKDGIRLVVLDSLSEMHDCEENDRGSMRQLVQGLRHVTEAGCAVLATHHERKPKASYGGARRRPSLADVRGSTALTGAVASVLACHCEGWSKEGELLFGATWTKANHATPEPRAFRFAMSKDRPGVIFYTGPASTGGRPARQGADLLVALEQLGGKDVEAWQVALHLGIGTRAARDELQTLHHRGLLPPSRHGKGNSRLWSLPGKESER